MLFIENGVISLHFHYTIYSTEIQHLSVFFNIFLLKADTKLASSIISIQSKTL